MIKNKESSSLNYWDVNNLYRCTSIYMAKNLYGFIWKMQDIF